MSAPIRQEYEAAVPLARLVPHPANPRRGDVGAIVASIRANGWRGALVVQRSTCHVLVGNHRLLAAGTLGLPTVPVLWIDCDDATAQRILVADNRASDLAAFDTVALTELLKTVTDSELAGMLFSPEDRAAMLASPATTADSAGAGAGVTGGALRSLVLSYPLADYRRVTDALRQLRERFELPTHAAVVARLLDARAPGAPPPVARRPRPGRRRRKGSQRGKAAPGSAPSGRGR
jgi:hypothetical protein